MQILSRLPASYQLSDNETGLDYQLKMRKIIIVIFIFLVYEPVHGQLLPFNSEYLSNMFLINPSFAGINGNTSVIFTSRIQWSGIAGAPKMQTFGIDRRINRKGIYDHTGKITGKRNFLNSGKFACGAFLFNDINDPFRRTGIYVAGAYHRSVGTGKRQSMSIGFSVSLYQLSIDERNFLPHDPEITITMNKETALTPNISAGITYYSKNYFAGISVVHALPVLVRSNRYEVGERIRPQLYIMTGYKFEFYRKYSIEPVLLLKNTPLQIDFSTKITYNNRLGLTLMYQSDNSLVSLIGLNFNRYFIGYSFEYSFGEIRKYSDGSHQLIIGFQTGKKPNSNNKTNISLYSLSNQ